MKIINTIAIIFCILILSVPANAVRHPQTAVDSVQTKQYYLPDGKIKSKDIEKSIGRKLKLKEKIALLFVKHKLKKTNKEGSNHSAALLFATGGLLFVIGGILVAVLGTWNPVLFGILIGVSVICTAVALKKTSIIKKNDPGKKKAKLARFIATLALVGLAIVAGAALLALSL